MPNTSEDRRLLSGRRQRDRRMYERRLRAIEEFIASRARHCTILDMRITPEGCVNICGQEPAFQCRDCSGVLVETRVAERRANENRRTGVDRRT
ncbi:MAG: hypothetical protein LBC79_09745 [Deltaproteobacteria bacterium]|jgi:hypothetical protein|nr:hypothetical protein [Deltaproteobacteria bacterium]